MFHNLKRDAEGASDLMMQRGAPDIKYTEYVLQNSGKPLDSAFRFNSFEKQDTYINNIVRHSRFKKL